MEHDKPIHRGNLLIPTAGKILLKKSWQQKYCLLFKASKFGVERLEIYDNVDATNQTPSRIITLQDCIKIIPRSTLYFAITNKSGLHEFGTLTSTSMNEWLTALQSVAFRDDCSKITSIEEDNDLYCPSGEGIFNVKLHSSPASIRCGLESKLYLLVLTNNGAQLRNCHDNKLLFTWPYCFIRRYGYKNGKFMFEAGRKCESGEGIFYLEHSDQQEIFRCFASKLKSMKKLLSNETFPTIFDMDNSFHGALSLEARSRSPLPLSFTTSTSMHDLEQNLSNKIQVIPSEIADVALNKLKPTVRPKPAKPPRKNIPSKEDSLKQVYEAVNKYDEIEYRSDAWKTMGVHDVNHVESELVEPEEEYMSWGVVKKVQNVVPQVTQAPKVITEPQNQEYYDKLNFFRSTSKLINSPSVYKQVKVTSNDLFSNPPSFNDYDEVEVEPGAKNMVIVDEKIDKDTRPNAVKIKDSPLSHQFHNNEPYAVISKPKQV